MHIIIYQCLMVLAIIKQQVTTCIITQNVFKNNAIRASLKERIGTTGLSSSVCPIRCPVARAHMRSKAFTQINPRSTHDGLHGMPCCFVSHELLHDSTIGAGFHLHPNSQECKHHSHTCRACRLVLHNLVLEE